jgi:hypothetical protein
MDSLTTGGVYRAARTAPGGWEAARDRAVDGANDIKDGAGQPARGFLGIPLRLSFAPQ